MARGDSECVKYYIWVCAGDPAGGRAAGLSRAHQTQSVHPRPASTLRQGIHAAVSLGKLRFFTFSDLKLV